MIVVPAAVEAAARIMVALLGMLLFVAVAVAYRRRPTPRMRLVLLAFFVFFLESIVLLVEVFIADTTFTETTYYLFRLIELGILSVALLKS